METAMNFTKEQLDLVTEYVGNKLNIVDNRENQDIKFNNISLNIENLHQDTKLLQQDTKQLQQDTKQLQQDTKQLQQDTKQLQQDTKQLQQDTKQLQQELIHQRELMSEGFKQVDKRFEESKEYYHGLYNFMKWQFGVSTLFLSGIMYKLLLG